MAQLKQKGRNIKVIRYINTLWLSYSAFQEEYTKGQYQAGMEQVNAAREEEEFKFVSETRHEDGLVSRTGNYSSKLNSLEGKWMGAMKWIPVEKGDTVNMEAYSLYRSNGARL